MDLVKILRELYAERQRLSKIIDALEALHGRKPEAVLKKRRGRKYMDAAGRREVSARMKKYWAARRQKQSEEDTNAAGN